LTWIIIGILAVLIIVFAVLAFRRRRAAYQPAPRAQPTPPAAAEKPGPLSLYCVHCGTENPSANEFCGKCGKKLLRAT
jgi:ribosomal protein L40E